MASLKSTVSWTTAGIRLCPISPLRSRRLYVHFGLPSVALSAHTASLPNLFSRVGLHAMRTVFSTATSEWVSSGAVRAAWLRHFSRPLAV